MRNNLLIFLLSSLPAFLLGGCAAEPHTRGGEGLSVTLAVDEMRMPTRNSSIPAQEGETTVNDLTLLFFEYRSDGGGRFVKAVVPAETPRMNGRYDIPFDAQITESGSYTILAMANTANYFDGGLIDRIASMTEREAIDRVTAMISGVGTDESDNANAILPSELIMSARVVRPAGRNDITVDLTRCPVRFDVENGVKGRYDLVSASIWNAVSESPLWHDRVIPGAARTQRFYGIARTEDFADIERGLYAFGNYVASPALADDQTTCLILGLKPAGGDISATTYHRVNVNVPGSAQNLLPNHVYRIRIEDVTGAGASTEYDAWRRSSSQIRTSLGVWNSDDEGMVQTDGENILIVPARRVNLDPSGETREYSIITRGAGTLSISRDELPLGIDVGLMGGRLVITADELTGDTPRRGSVELSFAGLRSTITIVQSRPDGIGLTLNRYEIPRFEAVGRTRISDNVPFRVTASGPWTATIHNLSGDPDDPGFSFEATGDPVVELRSTDNAYGDMFQVFTTGTNPDTANERYGLLVVSLEGSANINHAVVLVQAPAAP